MLDQSTDPAPPTRRELRRRQTIEQILAAAWALCSDQGLASLSLRDLAAKVGMRAPSLYSYFDSKSAIYDAMFLQGYQQMGQHMQELAPGAPVTRQKLKAGARHWFEFCTSNPTRYQLLFQRTIPDFEPTPQTYAVAVTNLQQIQQTFIDGGITDPSALDLWTALLTGLTDQQISNDPGGDRWGRLLDDAVDMFCDHLGVLAH